MSLREVRQNCTFMKLQCILIMLHILYILCDIMLFGDILHLPFDFGKDILITYQNSPKSVFYLFLWVQALVLYNLVLCYSLHPVLVIWHVTLIIFLQNQVYFSKLKKVSFGKSKLGRVKLGKTAVLVIFMLIYFNLCNCQLSPSLGDDYM